jgi:restriction system protein
MAPKGDRAPAFVKYIPAVVSALVRLGGSGRPDEVRAAIATDMQLSDADQLERLPSGVQSRFENQVHWARFYLAKAGFIGASQHGVWTLSDKARELGTISQAQARSVYHEVREQLLATRIASEVSDDETGEAETSIETEGILGRYRKAVLTRLRDLPPSGFERFSQRLLRESGFQEVTVTGRSGDGGIDGIGVLQVNPLVSFKVLFQCKKYTGSVTPSEVRDFRGAMTGRADKAIIITTGSFTAEAKREAVRDGAPSIELVDGDRLVDMLESLQLGLTRVQTFELNSSFFDDFAN